VCCDGVCEGNLDFLVEVGVATGIFSRGVKRDDDHFTYLFSRQMTPLDQRRLILDVSTLRVYRIACATLIN
jgi:hypothetical protein